MKIRNALISVFDKEGIELFATDLVLLGFNIYGSDGTAKRLRAAGLASVESVNTLVGEPILEHRVVTLSREIHAGLLAKDTPEHQAELDRLGIPRIDLVCVDFYPLEAEIAKAGHTHESVVEMTDIGGPAMARSGAKGGRIVICDKADRRKVIDWLKAGEPDTDAFVERLAAKAELMVAQYCLASAHFRSKGEFAAIDCHPVI